MAKCPIHSEELLTYRITLTNKGFSLSCIAGACIKCTRTYLNTPFFEEIDISGKRYIYLEQLEIEYPGDNYIKIQGNASPKSNQLCKIGSSNNIEQSTPVSSQHRNYSDLRNYVQNNPWKKYPIKRIKFVTKIPRYCGTDNNRLLHINHAILSINKSTITISGHCCLLCSTIYLLNSDKKSCLKELIKLK